AQQITDTRTPLPDGPPGEVRIVDAHEERIHDIAVTPDGKYFLTGSNDKLLKLWEFETGNEVLARDAARHKSVGAIDVSSDGRLVATAGDNRVALWRLPEVELVREFDGHDGHLTSIQFSPDDSLLVTGDADSTVRLWDIETGEELQTWTTGSGWGDAQFTPDGRFAFARTRADDLLSVWDVDTGVEQRQFAIPGGTGAVLSPDGRWLLRGLHAATADLAVLYNFASGEEHRRFTVDERDAGISLAFSNDSRHVLIGRRSGSVSLWNLEQTEELHVFDGHTQEVTAIAFTPDGRFAVSGSEDGEVRIWRLPESVVSETASPPVHVTAQWTDLFNGRDLTGWEIADNPEAWNVVDGVLVAEGPGKGWLLSEREFRDFELVLEYRMQPGADSGVSIRVPADNRLNEAIEVQVRDNENLSDRAKRFPRFQNGALVDRVGPTADPAYTDDRWNELTIRALGKNLSVDLNGQRIQDVDLDQLTRARPDLPAINLTAGRIALQHWSPAKAEFRRIRIRSIGVPTSDEGDDASRWTNLFNGTDLTGWVTYSDGSPPTGWTVDDGTLHLAGKGGDIMSSDAYSDFELEFEWKISEKGNSGVIYRVEPGQKQAWHSGPEYQLLDDVGHANGGKEITSAASIYNIAAPQNKTLRPVGQWNTARIVARGNHVEHWLNGAKVAEAEVGSSEWNAAVANSNFRKHSQFAQAASGHVVLQDHGDKVWFRNIRIRELSGEDAAETASSPGVSPSTDRIDLFNGRDLTGWRVEDDPAAWKVVDGAIVAEGDGKGYLFT
ncbi:MAG: DUF1080 domain-containing protein, partial [Planctomycetota bacterium]